MDISKLGSQRGVSIRSAEAEGAAKPAELAKTVASNTAAATSDSFERAAARGLFAVEHAPAPVAEASLEFFIASAGRLLEADTSEQTKVLADTLAQLKAEKQAGAAGGAGLVGGGDSDIMAVAFIVMMEAAKSAREDLEAIMDGVKSIHQAEQGVREEAGALRGSDDWPPQWLRASSSSAAAADVQATYAAHGVAIDVRPGAARATLGKNRTLHLWGDPHVTGSSSLAAQAQRLALTPTEARGLAAAVSDLRDGTSRLRDSAKSKLDSRSEMGETESARLQNSMDRLSKMMSTLSNLLKKIGDTGSSITQNLK